MKNVYRAYELDNQPTNLSNKFVIRNCSFGALELTKNEVKRKLIYSDYGMTFDESSSQNCHIIDFVETLSLLVSTLVYDSKNIFQNQVKNQPMILIKLFVTQKKISIKFPKSKIKVELTLQWL